MEAFAHDEGLVGAVADLEFAVEVVRSALARLSPPGRATREREPDRGPGQIDGSRANHIGKEGRPHG